MIKIKNKNKKKIHKLQIHIFCDWIPKYFFNLLAVIETIQNVTILALKYFQYQFSFILLLTLLSDLINATTK